MKAFYIVTAVCALLICGIIVSRIYVYNFTNEARTQLSRIEFEDKDAESKFLIFSKSLNERIKKAEFSISKDKSDSINDYLSLMESQLKNNDKFGFEETKILLDNTLKQIWELEELSLSNLF